MNDRRSMYFSVCCKGKSSVATKSESNLKNQPEIFFYYKFMYYNW